MMIFFTLYFFCPVLRGLAISYQIICERHQGSLEVFSPLDRETIDQIPNSRVEGSGAEFVIQLPIETEIS